MSVSEATFLSADICVYGGYPQFMESSICIYLILYIIYIYMFITVLTALCLVGFTKLPNGPHHFVGASEVI